MAGDGGEGVRHGQVMGSLRKDLEKLYDEQEGRLFVCALAITRCPAVAEDAVHDAFRRLLSLDRRPRDVKTYAFQCVRNAAIDMRRRDGREERAPAGFIFDPRDPGEQAGDREFCERAAAMLLDLSDGEREVIVGHLYAGLTFREIAEIRGDSANTVASWYRRGLEKLRRQLENHDGQL